MTYSVLVKGYETGDVQQLVLDLIKAGIDFTAKSQHYGFWEISVAPANAPELDYFAEELRI